MENCVSTSLNVHLFRADAVLADDFRMKTSGHLKQNLAFSHLVRLGGWAERWRWVASSTVASCYFCI